MQPADREAERQRGREACVGSPGEGEEWLAWCLVVTATPSGSATAPLTGDLISYVITLTPLLTNAVPERGHGMHLFRVIVKRINTGHRFEVVEVLGNLSDDISVMNIYIYIN